MSSFTELMAGRVGVVALGRDYEKQDCSLARTLELVGERWTMLVLRDAFYGVHRYRDFLCHLDIPRAVLSDRLKTLVDAGALAKRRYSDAPPRDEYLLTERGIELWPALFALAQWGERHLSTSGPKRVFAHVTCGSPLDRTGSCAACGEAVQPGEVVVSPGPGADFAVRSDPVSVALRVPHRLLTPLLTGPGR